MKKRIAIIIERSDIALGGAERSIFELSNALSALGHDIELLVAKGQAEAKHIHILCGQSKGRTCYQAFSKALKKHLYENKYDIIHSVLPFDFADVYQPRGGSYAEAVLRNAASYDSKLRQSYKKLTSFVNFRRTQLLRAEKNLCTNSSGPIVAALSEYVADQFRRHYALDDERIAVIPNGIKIDKKVNLAEADHLRGQILSKLKLKEADEPVLFLFVANNFRLKGLGPLIKAMQLCQQDKNGKNAYLVVAGSGSAGKYRHLAKKLKVQDHIIFLGSLRHVANGLSVADVAALPTYYDPASRYILEAIAANKPAITTRFNGATDLFVEDRHGKIIDEPGDIEALAKAIGYFSQRENIKTACENIQADNLKENISINRAALQLDRLYESIIEKRRRA